MGPALLWTLTSAWTLGGLWFESPSRAQWGLSVHPGVEATSLWPIPTFQSWFKMKLRRSCNIFGRMRQKSYMGFHLTAQQLLALLPQIDSDS